MSRPFVILAALAALGLAGCPATSSDEGAPTADTDGDGPNGGAAAECTLDSDCTAAGDSCCVCPSYAVPKSSGWDDSCEDVTCEPPQGCSTEPVCEQGLCMLRCAEVACPGDASCAGGFARDEAGCLTCACADGADPGAAECEIDADCVQVAADCCGCEEGGSDTAVPVDQATDFTNSLGCDGSTTCPGVDVCDPNDVPRCIGGSCELVSSSDPDDESPPDGGAGAEEPQLCGTPELPACPAGESCVVNAADYPEADEMGVGVCL